MKEDRILDAMMDNRFSDDRPSGNDGTGLGLIPSIRKNPFQDDLKPVSDG